MNLKSLISKIPTLFLGAQHVGALEISHSSIKYLILSGSKEVKQTEVRLEPGIIEQGKVKDKEKLIAKLKELHSSIAKNEKNQVDIHLIVSSAIVFAQPFSVPPLPEKDLEEAINLNLQMISPNEIEESYYGWQEIEKNPADGSLQLLGAFTKASVVNEYESALSSSGFHIFSIEFPAVSISRLVESRWEKIDGGTKYLSLYLNSEGILMLILKNKNLYFSHFTPWVDILAKHEQSKEIKFEEIKSFLSQEVQRVINFYLSRHGEKLNRALLISPLFNFEIVSLLEENFKIKTKNLTLPDLPQLSPAWFPTLGASLRRITNRKKDSLSLSKTSVTHEYSQERALIFISFWRKIFLTVSIFFFLVFLGLDSYLYLAQKERDHELSTIENIKSFNDQLPQLRENAQQFNDLISQIEAVNSQDNNWSPLVEKVQEISGQDVELNRIFADKTNLSVLLNGTAADEQAAIAFKNRLIDQEEFTNISLPLSNITSSNSLEKQVGFSLTFQITANAKITSEEPMQESLNENSEETEVQPSTDQETGSQEADSQEELAS
jgi:Tfp pilus assembly PilM family ATPase